MKRFYISVAAWVLVVASVLAVNVDQAPAAVPVMPDSEPALHATHTVMVIQSVSEESANREAISFYPIPMDHDLQAHIIHTCQDYGIDPAVVMAMVNQESSFNAGAIGDDGESSGLLQVQEKHHKARMERLGVDDLLNPYQNATVAIDYLAELLEKYDGDLEMALTAYNCGPTGAYRNYFQHGIHSNEYSRDVIRNTVDLREGEDIASIQNG